MRLIYAILIGFLGSQTIWGQTLYFPPTTGNTWQTQSPTELGWCSDEIDPLVNFLATTNTKAFMVLKDGKIVNRAIFWHFYAR